MTKDLTEGLRLKEEGLDRVEISSKDWLELVRAEARAIATQKGSVHADDLRFWADLTDNQPPHKNCWGAVFRGAGWIKVGERKSAYKSNRGHCSPIWMLAQR